MPTLTPAPPQKARPSSQNDDDLRVETAESIPHDTDPQGRRVPAAYGRWCEDERDDPVTGLVAWPGFHRRLPALLAQAVSAAQPVGLAIGDVDNLKTYVETVRAAEPRLFGHLAGNAFMSRLGVLARTWLRRLQLSQACLATFGGDEIILAAEVDNRSVFGTYVQELRDLLCAQLPCSVSFSYVVVDDLPRGVTLGDTAGWVDATDQVIVSVERELFAGKHGRRPGRGSGFVKASGVANRGMADWLAGRDMPSDTGGAHGSHLRRADRALSALASNYRTIAAESDGDRAVTYTQVACDLENLAGELTGAPNAEPLRQETWAPAVT